MTAIPKSQSAAAWSVRVVFRSVESGPEGPSGARQRQQYGSAVRLIVALPGAALAGLGDIHVERFDTGDGPPAIEPNQLAPYLYLIGSKVT